MKYVVRITETYTYIVDAGTEEQAEEEAQGRHDNAMEPVDEYSVDVFQMNESDDEETPRHD